MTGYCHICQATYTKDHPKCLSKSPLPHYAGYEVMHGRMRSVVGPELFAATCDKTNQDRGDM